MTDLDELTHPAGTPTQRDLAAEWIRLSRRSRHHPRGRYAVWPAARDLAAQASARLVDGRTLEALDFAVASQLCVHIAMGYPSSTPVRAFHKALR